MNEAMPLAMAKEGEIVEVVGMRGGLGLERKLANMGLTPGVKIRVIHSQVAGPVLIELRGGRVGLGRGVAQKVLVKL